MQVWGNYKYTQNAIPRTEGKRNDLVLTEVGGRILKLNFQKGGGWGEYSEWINWNMNEFKWIGSGTMW